MIGDMFNNELKAKVDRLCRAVSEFPTQRTDSHRGGRVTT